MSNRTKPAGEHEAPADGIAVPSGEPMVTLSYARLEEIASEAGQLQNNLGEANLLFQKGNRSAFEKRFHTICAQADRLVILTKSMGG